MEVEGTCSDKGFHQTSSGPRVGFGEHHVSPAATSLLTFADMVLSFDRKTALGSVSKSPNVSVNKKVLTEFRFKDSSTDHTYASSTSSRTTRSQTAKAAHLSAISNDLKAELSCEESDEDIRLCIDLDADSDTNVSNTPEGEQLSQSTSIGSNSASCRNQIQSSKSVTQHFHSDAHNYCLKDEDVKPTDTLVCKQLHSASQSNKLYSILDPKCEKAYGTKLDKSSRNIKMEMAEVVQTKSPTVKLKGFPENSNHSFGSNKIIFNNLEFPSWHRKADHTYATATWDGTAAGHNIFDGHKSQTSFADQQMEDVENRTPLNLHINSDALTLLTSQQKDDHTYVKSDAASANKALSNSSSNISPKTRFSCATFPRLKSREDHTYFHSGLGAGSSTKGREWASAQTVATFNSSQEMQIEECCRNLHSFSQCASAKKDHNYSTSA